MNTQPIMRYIFVKIRCFYTSTRKSHQFTNSSFYLKNKIVQVSQVRELTEVKEVITPYGRSGSEETIVILRKT